jgi:hypothetical protein
MDKQSNGAGGHRVTALGSRQAVGRGPLQEERRGITSIGLGAKGDERRGITSTGTGAKGDERRGR